MTIGDKVIFQDKFSDTMVGVIIDKKQPRCKCKGMGEWIIDFNGETKHIKISDERLSLYNINPKMGSIKHSF